MFRTTNNRKKRKLFLRTWSITEYNILSLVSYLLTDAEKLPDTLAALQLSSGNPLGSDKSRRAWHASNSFASIIFQRLICPLKLTWEPLWKTVWWFLKKLNIDLPYDTTILPLGIYSRELKTGPHKNLNTDSHTGIIHNSQKLETTQMFIN